MRSRTILILGGSGFVGRHLCAALAAEGHAVRVLTRHPEHARPLRVLPGVTVIGADPFDREALLAHARGCDALINLVGILNERGRSGRGFERAHVELARRAVAACVAEGVPRLLHMSGLPAAADGPSHYLRTKAAAEAVVRDCPAAVAWTIFRPSVIFGPNDSFANRFAGLLKTLPVLPLARIDALLAPVYVGDVCAAFVRALNDDRTAARSYDLCGPRVMSLGEVVRYVAQVLGRRRLVFGLPDWAGALQAGLMELLPGKPLSLDNYRSLSAQSVCACDGLASLGIQATPIEAIVPGYLGGTDPARRLAALRARGRRP